ncbi:hypothetical protein HPY28_22290 [Brevibacillus sp. HB1.2]|uniref:hypothetical protein n=1 Tax=Brevibacillus TaxID=55080 RepID=UPI000364C19D|nr:hypothetical protein [Brevibacillus sp. HB1.2]NTU23050.1 hypothetical protein [Brevibacillus sp. HB1.2]
MYRYILIYVDPSHSKENMRTGGKTVERENRKPDHWIGQKKSFYDAIQSMTNEMDINTM